MVGSFDHAPEKRDSGVDLSDEKLPGGVKIKNRKSNAEQKMAGSDIHFKSGMIFDLEM